MTRTRLRAAAFVAAAGVLSACASSPDRSPEERFEKDLGDIICDRSYPAACGERGGAACTQIEAFVPLQVSMLEQVGGAFDEDAAAKCLDHLRDVPVANREVRCAGVMRGKKLPGESCASSYECARSEVGVARCRFADEEPIDALDAARVCEIRVRAAIGEPCVPLLERAPSDVRYVCDDSEAFCDPLARRCAPLPAIGEPCRVFPDPGHEDEGYGCAAGASCEASQPLGSGSVCVAGRAEGAPCADASAVCASGLRCSDSRPDGDSYRCVRPTRAEGEPCLGDSDCVRGACYGGSCTASPPDTLGDVGVTLGCN